MTITIVPEQQLSGFLNGFTKALLFATKAHGQQTRKDGKTPYIIHPIRVFEILLEIGCCNLELAQAALNHDVVEDCGISLLQIETAFGPKVKNLVAECSEDKTLSKHVRKRQELEHVRNTKDHHIALLKAADKLDSIRDTMPASWSADYIRGYIFWTYAIVSEHANEYPFLKTRMNQTYESLISQYGYKYPPRYIEVNVELENYYRVIETEEQASKKHKNYFVISFITFMFLIFGTFIFIIAFVF
jgi:(p)ppGpp synthase/HD superfamily hydrolase